MEATISVLLIAGGCFWCLESPFDKLPGVISTISGYTGGHLENPTYEQVSKGSTGHFEALEVKYDPKKITYEKLLETFWHNIDPLDGAGQFCDKGDQYRSAIFYLNDEQKQAAEKSKEEIKKILKKDIQTQILPAKKYYPAEDYHQDYYKKNPIRYKFYRASCGRDKRLKQLWGLKAP